MPLRQLREMLDNEGIRYVLIIHSKAFTAQEIAASSHIPGKQLAKTVMITVDGKMAMAVLPASTKVDFHMLESITGTENVELAEEDEFKDLFPGCETGAMPPFGNLFGMDVYVAEVLTEDQEIFFNAGSHTELMQISYEDFERLAKPIVARFAVQA